MKLKIQFLSFIIGFVLIALQGVFANNPPNMPGNPSPENGITNQSTITVLGWMGGDLDNDPVIYTLYFGTNTPPPYKGTTSNTTYNLSLLEYNTQYYWQIKAQDSKGSSTTGPIWNFKTVSKDAPSPPTNLSIKALSHEKIKLSWSDNSNNEDGFGIERKKEAGSYVLISNVGSNTSSFEDKGLEVTTLYYYRVYAYNGSGISSYSNCVSITTPMESSFIPYNNLFDPTKGEEVSINYFLGLADYVELKIYTLNGRLVKTLVDCDKPAGNHWINWDGRDGNRDIVPSGIYIVYIKSGEFKDRKKIAVVK